MSASRSSVTGWARYGAAIVVLAWLVVSGGGFAYQGLASLLDNEALQTPVDTAVVQAVTRAAEFRAALASDRPDKPALPDSEAFVHARPAPRLFEEAKPQEIEQIKSSVTEQVNAEGSDAWYSGSGHTYTTVCVRLCDGAYFPVSYSTDRRHFARDEAVCKSRCAAPARLFVRPNPGGSVEAMTDRSGHSYAALPTAFQFRRGLAAGCSCKADPWDQAEMARHANYAASASRTAGSRTALAADAHAQSTVAEPPKRHTHDSSARVVGKQIASLGDAADVRDAVPVVATPNAPVVPELSGLRRVTKRAVEPPVEQIETVNLVKVVKARSRSQIGKSASNAKRTASPPPPASLANLLRGTIEGEETRVWGAGRNSVLAPRGATANEIFARNFY